MKMKTFYDRFLVDLRGAAGKAARGRYSSSLIILSVTLFAFHLLAATSAAQTVTSTIEGVVTDANGAVVAGASIKVTSPVLGSDRTVTSNQDGFYRIAALPAGTYTVTVTGKGFGDKTTTVELTLNRVATYDVQLAVGNVGGNVEVTDVLPLLEPNASSTGTTVTPKQIQDLPVNGRDYLDLMQVVPGVVLNRRQPDGDNANPVLGERSGNNNFLIDGQPNKDTVNGGPASQFNQESIAEFQVLTTGFKAEFGQASGAIVNVVTRSGANKFHGVGSFFHRNDAFDSSNSLTEGAEAPELKRYDYSFALGGPIWKDKVFFFGSTERITEDRGIDFVFPDLGSSAGATQVENILHAQEDPLDGPRTYKDLRNFIKLNENLGRHQLVQEFNYTNGNIHGSGFGLPSTRSRSGERHLMFGAADTMLLGDQANPWIVTVRGGYRGEPFDDGPQHPQFPGSTTLSPFTAQGAALISGNLPTATFGRLFTDSRLDQSYTSFSANANKVFGDHDLKFGWNYLKTKVDGIDPLGQQVQLFATVDDYAHFAPAESGIFLLATTGGVTPEAREIHLRNNYHALYFQDDWKIAKNLTVNLGIRWDYDSEFSSKTNFSPRLGVAWSIDPKTVIRAHYGKFFDQFRLGLVQLVPSFGGADRRIFQDLYFPRGLYGSPSWVSSIAFLSGLPGGCFSFNKTDAEITAGGLGCGFPGLGALPMIGVDRLNRVVAANHAFIPANAVINESTIQNQSGLAPDAWLAAAAAAINQPAGYFQWGEGGYLRNRIIPPQVSPTSVDSTFETPHTQSFSVGVQRELTKDLVLEVDYYHRKMNNLLGTRYTNLTFQSRVTGRAFSPNPAGPISTFGPFFEGKYDAVIVGLQKRFSNHYQFAVSYTGAEATDNNLGIATPPSDSFVGIVPLVTEPSTGRNNQNAGFQTTLGRWVTQAGTFLNGPDRDKGPSDLALRHILQFNGLVELPWQFQIAGIFRAQSGYHYSRASTLTAPYDYDGDSQYRGIDLTYGRNAFTAPAFVNLDIRFSKRFNITERVKLHALFEFFNVLNRQNPASVSQRVDIPSQPFGSVTQVLPGREGQIGLRVEF